MEAIESKINKIVACAIDSIPSETWEDFSVNVFALNKMLEMQAWYERNGEVLSFDPESTGTDLMMEFKSLRELMYIQAPNKGGWFSAWLTVTNDSKVNMHFEYNEKPDFEYEPGKEKFIDDLTVFPREPALIPDWLAALVAAK